MSIEKLGVVGAGMMGSEIALVFAMAGKSVLLADTSEEGLKAAIKKLSEVAFIEVITNGDTLNSNTLKKLYNAKASKVLISMYDGPEQIKKFKRIIKISKVPKDLVILRDRWYGKSKDYGVKLTNRTGTIKVGNQVSNNFHKKCYYPSYQVLIDWNGDVFLCPQDWQRRNTMGNMMQESIFNIWTGEILKKYRKLLLEGKRKLSPCNSCNATGTLLGYKHAKAWLEFAR